MNRIAQTLAATLALAGPLAARPVLVPIPTGVETAHFLRGTPTVSLETASGAVEVTPLPLDHGHANFGIAVYNKGIAPANFGLENILASVGGTGLVVLSEAELARRAKSRALWTQVGIAVVTGGLAGAAGAAVASSRSHGSVATPHGGYRWASSTTDPAAGALVAGGVAAGGGAAMAGVRGRLDATIGELSADVVQLTTVDAQSSYGGRIVLERPANGRLPYDVRLNIRWNGMDYPFAFRMTEEGQNLPPAYPLPAAPALAATDAGLLPAPAPALRPALMVLPAAAKPVRPVEVAAVTVSEVEVVTVASAARPAGLAASPRARAYRNGRDDGLIVPMQ